MSRKRKTAFDSEILTKMNSTSNERDTTLVRSHVRALMRTENVYPHNEWQESTDEECGATKRQSLPSTFTYKPDEDTDEETSNTEEDFVKKKSTFNKKREKHSRWSESGTVKSGHFSGEIKTPNDYKMSLHSSIGEEQIKPLYKNYQLLGDSQFVRFSKQILNIKDVRSSIGYCISGQKIQGLYNMLIKKEYKLHKNVIVMIGTNDLKYNYISLISMTETYTKLLELLKEYAENIVLVTLPPIQFLANSLLHWRKFEAFNKFILEQHNGKQIFVVDFGQHLTGYGGYTGCTEYFEEIYRSDTEKKDLMHLNRKGFYFLKFLLDLHYFQDID